MDIFKSKIEQKIQCFRLGMENGFTGVEIVIVLGVIGILSSIVLPGITSLKQVYKVKSAANTLVADLQWTRMKAVMENSDYRIAFNTINNSYTITGPNANKTKNLDSSIQFGVSNSLTGVVAGGVIGGAIDFPEGSSVNEIIFTGTGSMQNSGGIYLTPKSDINPYSQQNRTRAIKITGSTGSMAIYTIADNAWSR